MIHVGDGDVHADRVVVQPLGELHLVQVQRLGVVERGPEQAAEVADVTGRGVALTCIGRHGATRERLELCGRAGRQGEVESLVEHGAAGELTEVDVCGGCGGGVRLGSAGHGGGLR